MTRNRGVTVQHIDLKAKEGQLNFSLVCGNGLGFIMENGMTKVDSCMHSSGVANIIRALEFGTALRSRSSAALLQRSITIMGI